MIYDSICFDRDDMIYLMIVSDMLLYDDKYKLKDKWQMENESPMKG